MKIGDVPTFIGSSYSNQTYTGDSLTSGVGLLGIAARIRDLKMVVVTIAEF